jgi:acyl-CoA thioesterase FadM
VLRRSVGRRAWWAHGGAIASGFDIVLGRAVTEFADRGPTAEIHIRYRTPTPLGADVEFRSWLDRREGRKTFVAGDLRIAGSGVVCAEATGLFVAAQPPASQ